MEEGCMPQGKVEVREPQTQFEFNSSDSDCSRASKAMMPVAERLRRVNAGQLFHAFDGQLLIVSPTMPTSGVERYGRRSALW